MKVGFFIKGEGEIFENGCNQQALFVYQTFDAMDIKCTFSTTDGGSFMNIPTVNINTHFYKIYELDICNSKIMKFKKGKGGIKESFLHGLMHGSDVKVDVFQKLAFLQK
mgnify:CR=1 FL=1